MNAKEVIRDLFRTTDYMVTEYLKDLSDADLLVRPVPEANHIAWQLGHLINSEVQMHKAIPGAATMVLPAGWSAQYTKETSRAESPASFLTKAEYLSTYRKVRAHSLEVLASLPEPILDKPTEGRLASIAPSIGSLFALIAYHPMMHVGQFVVVRRKLGKPVVI